MKYWLLALLGVFIGLVIFLAVLFDDDSEEALEAVTSSLISTTTTSSSTTTSSAPTTIPPTTTVPTYTGPLYPQLFIDATDEESCSWLGGDWRYGPPGWGQYCAPDRFSLASNSDLCERLTYVWSEEQQRCNKPDPDLLNIEEESACIDLGGVWHLRIYGKHACMDDEGTIRTAYFEDVCLERGGTWGTDETSWKPEYFECYEDDGSLWDARHRTTCIDRGGSWDPERMHSHPEVEGLIGHCFEDFGGLSEAFDEVTCGARGGIWTIDKTQYSTIHACLTYETEYELEDLFDSNSDWKNILFRNCEDPDETLNQLSGFMIGGNGVDLFWEVDNLTCRPLAPELEDDFHSPSYIWDLSVLNEEGRETQFYVMNAAWIALMEVLDIEGPGFTAFARVYATSSKDEVLFSGCAPCWHPGIKGWDHLFIMSSDGTDRRRLFGACYRYCNPVSFSPDGESFLFYEVYNGSISSGLYQIGLGENPSRVLNPELDHRATEGVIHNVSVSPNGTQIAFWISINPLIRPDLFITDFEGSPTRKITNFDPMDVYSFNYFSGGTDIFWSPDETQIGFCFHHEHQTVELYGTGDSCAEPLAVNTSASSTSEFEEISLETYELWANQ